ncbi:IS66 family insertion sequence element accessory protein TnpA, partial [Negativicoccus succinicivorans]
TINQFCQTKGITKAQLYYYRKKFNDQNQDSIEFCQVTLESTKVTKSYSDTNVTFELRIVF